ncbi:MAG TPA: dihydroxy-acid dehydratase [Elusimicrobiota bacterium]|nr:dihydroxy-acid dehydratase [Elusimicrobiota bacterium]
MKKKRTEDHTPSAESVGKPAAVPLIGIIVCAADSLCDSPGLQNLVRAVQGGVFATGGRPRVFSLCSGFGAAVPRSDGFQCLLPRRDLLADQLECLVRGTVLHGLVLMGEQNDLLAGLLMGAARLNLPALVVPIGGSVPAVSRSPHPMDELARSILSGREENREDPCERDSVRSDDYASNAMACLAEGIGLSMPRSSTVAKGSVDQFRLAREAGRRAVDLVRQNLPVRRFLLLSSFCNAARLDAAFGGTSDVLVHLMALSREAVAGFTLDKFEAAGRQTPCLCWIPGIPSVFKEGKDTLSRFHEAGGMPALLSALGHELQPHGTVLGKNIVDLAKSVRGPVDSDVIRTKRPYRREGGLVFLRGNLAPEGAVLQVNPETCAPPDGRFSGSARVFDSSSAAVQALAKKQIKRGDAVVVRYEGPAGAPGLRSVGIVARLISALGLSTDTLLVTDGRLSGMGNATAVEMVSPEAAGRSALSILKEGDRVTLDMNARSLVVHLTDTDIKVRLARWQMPPGRPESGYLSRYARGVGSALKGALGQS